MAYGCNTVRRNIFTQSITNKNQIIMDQQIEKIKSIESKIQKLIELNKNLAEEKTMFEDENKQLLEQVKTLKEMVRMNEQQIDMQRQQLTELEEMNKSLNLATNETTETKEENKFLKTRIDEYVKEIDKCLELLDK
jgi:peptidoglycan hydrolase CwlO-like protein